MSAYYIYVGGHPFDTTNLTTSGHELGTGCDVGSRNQFSSDGWIQWPVPGDGVYLFDTNGTTWDTQIAIYDGVDCFAPCLASDDDSGIGRRSAVQVPLVVDQKILIQIGGYNGAKGPGHLQITRLGSPCTGIYGDGVQGNNTCGSAEPLTNGMSAGLLAERKKKDHFSFCVASGKTVDLDVYFSQSNGDLDIVLWDAADLACGSGNAGSTLLAESSSTSHNEFLQWTNTTGADKEVILEVNVADTSVTDCNTYDILLAGSGCNNATGTPFCNPVLNSAGTATLLEGYWGSAIESDLHLEINQGPPSQFGYMLIGNMNTAPGISLNGGQFCLAGVPGAAFYRYYVTGGVTSSVGRFDANGRMLNIVGTSSTGYGFEVPTTIPAAAVIAPGSTWHFQYWHRDTSAGIGVSNLSNGLSVTF